MRPICFCTSNLRFERLYYPIRMCNGNGTYVKIACFFYGYFVNELTILSEQRQKQKKAFVSRAERLAIFGKIRYNKAE